MKNGRGVLRSCQSTLHQAKACFHALHEFAAAVIYWRSLRDSAIGDTYAGTLHKKQGVRVKMLSA